MSWKDFSRAKGRTGAYNFLQLQSLSLEYRGCEPQMGQAATQAHADPSTWLLGTWMTDSHHFKPVLALPQEVQLGQAPKG